MERWRTVKQASESESVINRSRFIGRCYPAADEDEAIALLAAVRAEFPDASHTCYAYRVGERGQTARFSDAGEPGGTAGMPILDVLRKKGLTNVLCTVTRYFGGILLGTGGLVRAYSGSAADAVAAAGEVEVIPADVFEIVTDYSRYGALEGFLRASGEVRGVSFTDAVTVELAVAAEDSVSFAAALTERTDGRIKAKRVAESLIERAIS